MDRRSMFAALLSPFLPKSITKASAATGVFSVKIDDYSGWDHGRLLTGQAKFKIVMEAMAKNPIAPIGQRNFRVPFERLQ